MSVDVWGALMLPIILFVAVLTYTFAFSRVDSRIEIFTLSIQHEALYFPKLLGFVEIPKDHTDFECLLEGLPVLLAAQVRTSSSCSVFPSLQKHILFQLLIDSRLLNIAHCGSHAGGCQDLRAQQEP